MDEQPAPARLWEITMTLVVVTEHDIMTAQRGSAIDCPIARAASRAFGRPMKANFACIRDGVCTSRLPDFVANWMMNFDAGNPVPRIWFYV
jgi:hypothetical protein